MYVCIVCMYVMLGLGQGKLCVYGRLSVNILYVLLCFIHVCRVRVQVMHAGMEVDLWQGLKVVRCFLCVNVCQVKVVVRVRVGYGYYVYALYMYAYKLGQCQGLCGVRIIVCMHAFQGYGHCMYALSMYDFTYVFVRRRVRKCKYSFFFCFLFVLMLCF